MLKGVKNKVAVLSIKTPAVSKQSSWLPSQQLDWDCLGRLVEPINKVSSQLKYWLDIHVNIRFYEYAPLLADITRTLIRLPCSLSPTWKALHDFNL